MSTEVSSINESDRVALIEALPRLWAQGAASGAAIDGNFDASEIARRGAQRRADTRRNDWNATAPYT